MFRKCFSSLGLIMTSLILAALGVLCANTGFALCDGNSYNYKKCVGAYGDLNVACGTTGYEDPVDGKCEMTDSHSDCCQLVTTVINLKEWTCSAGSGNGGTVCICNVTGNTKPGGVCDC